MTDSNINQISEAAEAIRQRHLANKLDGDRRIATNLSYLSIMDDLEVTKPDYETLDKLHHVWKYLEEIDKEDPTRALYGLLTNLPPITLNESRLSQVLHHIKMKQLGNKHKAMVEKYEKESKW